jgi:hypothetical protein
MQFLLFWIIFGVVPALLYLSYNFKWIRHIVLALALFTVPAYVAAVVIKVFVL